MSIKTLLYPLTNTQTGTIEQRRAMLRKAIVKFPLDARFEHALQATITSEFIQRAARRGVFISYHRNDEVFALELDNALRQAGARVWMDAMDMAEGVDWREAVVAALRDCGILLLILSPDAISDQDIQHEMQFFWETGKIIIPVIHQTCDLTNVDLSVPPVDFRQQPERALLRLKRLLLPTER